MTDPFATSQRDISRLGKALDLDVRVAEERNTTSEDVKSMETIENISSWKSKYFTVLGFFLVFLAIFLIVIVLLIYKIRKSKVSNPAHCSLFVLTLLCSESELSAANQSRSSPEGGEEDEGGLLQCDGGGGGGPGQTAPDPRHTAGSVIPVLERQSWTRSYFIPSLRLYSETTPNYNNYNYIYSENI